MTIGAINNEVAAAECMIAAALRSITKLKTLMREGEPNVEMAVPATNSAAG